MLLTRMANALYRAGSESKSERVFPQNTYRPPTNVPYVVDNLWEWARPAALPSRRTAIFASPNPDEARATQGNARTIFVRSVSGLPRGWKLAQHDSADAKTDPDVKILPKLIRELLKPDWFSLEMHDKAPESQLFCPTLRSEEVSAILNASKRLDADRIFQAIRFWKERVHHIHYDEQQLLDSGEVFFEIPPEGILLEGTDPSENDALR